MKLKDTVVLVIENASCDPTEWGISFTSHDPEPVDYFKMPDEETAFRLAEYLNGFIHDLKQEY